MSAETTAQDQERQGWTKKDQPQEPKLSRDATLAARYFPRHRATYGASEVAGRHVEVLEWSEPGTFVHFIRYVAINGTLYVSGDLGEAVYVTGADSLKWWARCDAHYFAGKCMASEDGRGYRTWDGEAARERVREHVAQMREDGREIDEDDVADALAAADGGRADWDAWMTYHAHRLFGDDWWDYVPRFGSVIHDRCRLHLIGLRLATDSLAGAPVPAVD